MRYFMMPPGLVAGAELPTRRGPIEAYADRFRVRVKADAEPFCYPDRDLEAELAIMLSAAQGVSKTVRRNAREMREDVFDQSAM